MGMESGSRILQTIRLAIPKLVQRQNGQRFFSQRHAPLRDLRSSPQPRLLPLRSTRFNSISSTPTNPAKSPSTTSEGPAREQTPAYELTFTCKPCTGRSTHRISKQGYHKGTVLITCPECKNRHIISDHLKIFSNKSMTVEDLMRENGDLVKKGTLGVDGDVEFWDDGSSTTRIKREALPGGARLY